jgi:fumarylacetoacetase
MTSNGANVRTGDLFASGTVSGPEPGSYGSLIELGHAFLEDGDTVVLRGWCGEGDNRVDLGDVVGTVVAGKEA